MHVIREPSIFDELDIVKERNGKFGEALDLDYASRRLNEVIWERQWDAQVVIDSETYCYFADLFWEEVRAFFAERHPNRWMEVHSDGTQKGGAARMSAFFSNAEQLARYFKEWQRWRKQFHLYHHEVFSYAVYDLFGGENIIQVVKFEPDDLAELLNAATKSNHGLFTSWLRNRLGL